MLDKQGVHVDWEDEPVVVENEPAGHNAQVGKVEPIEKEPAGHNVQDRDPASELEPTGQDVQFWIEPTGKAHVPSEGERIRETVGPYAPAEHFHV